MDEPDATRSRLEDAIQADAALLADQADAFLGGWYLITVWVDTDGEKWLGRVASDGMVSWDRIGLLAFSLTQEKAASIGDEDE